MPVSTPASVTYTAIPMTLNVDGSADMFITKQVVFTDGTPTETLSKTSVHLAPADVAAVLAGAPDPSRVTRQADFNFAVYQFLISKGLVPNGTIS